MCARRPRPRAGGITPIAFGEKSSPLDLHETEKRLIMQALATTNGNVTAAAKKLGISRRTLHRKINEMKVANEIDGIDALTQPARQASLDFPIRDLKSEAEDGSRR